MHVYRVYEVVPNDPKPRDTGKTVSVKLSKDYYGRVTNREDEIIHAIFKLYGFTQYIHYYYIGDQSTDDIIYVQYNYYDEPDGYGRMKHTWILKRGA